MSQIILKIPSYDQCFKERLVAFSIQLTASPQTTSMAEEREDSHMSLIIIAPAQKVSPSKSFLSARLDAWSLLTGKQALLGMK